MDSLPPIPPPLPPPVPPFQQQLPPLPKKSGMPGWAIGIIVVFGFILVVGFFAGLAIPSYNRIKERAKVYAASKPPPPLTTEQKAAALKFGDKIVTALKNKNWAALESMTDFEVVAHRSCEGLMMGRSVELGFIIGVKKSPGGLLSQIAGSGAKLVRLTERAGYPAFTVRISPVGGGINFVDILVKPDKDEFKVVDLYGYMFGVLTSEQAKQSMMSMQHFDKAMIARVLGVKSASESDLTILLKVFEGVPKGDFKGICSSYLKLSPEMRRSRVAFTCYVTALQRLQGTSPEIDKQYGDALASAHDILGPDPASDLLMVDLHLMHNDYKSAKTCLDHVLAAVGRDARLLQIKGMVAVKDGDQATAESCLIEAEKLEPDLVDLGDLRLQSCALKRDFAGVVSELLRFARKYKGHGITPRMLTEPVFDEFKKSPEFAEWAALLEAQP